MNIHLLLQPEMRVRDENKEQRLRKQALKMIAKYGLEQFSIQKLAKKAGVSPGTIYIYFKDKDDLILQLCTEQMQKMTETSLDGFSPDMPFHVGLKIQWINRARYGLKYHDEVMFLEQIKHSAHHFKAIGMLSDGFRNSMKEFVSNAIKRNQLVKVPLEVFWSVAYGPLYNLLAFHKRGTSLGGKKFTFSDEVMMQTLGLVLKALKP
jgi:TetR/AcrR family transcriptional regulator, multidrug resistance operon repressor